MNGQKPYHKPPRKQFDYRITLECGHNVMTRTQPLDKRQKFTCRANAGCGYQQPWTFYTGPHGYSRTNPLYSDRKQESDTENMKPVQGETAHTGEERYEVKLTYTAEQLPEVKRLIETGQIIPDTVILVWTRRVGASWVRLSAGGKGSRAEGHQKLMYDTGGARGPRKAREIYTRELGDIRPWAQMMPGLRGAIEEAEAELPQ